MVINKLESLIINGTAINHHRIHGYYKHLKREYCVYLYLIYLKKYPTLEELNNHENDIIPCHIKHQQIMIEGLTLQHRLISSPGIKNGGILNFIPDTKHILNLIYHVSTNTQDPRNFSCDRLINFFRNRNKIMGSIPQK